MLLLKELFSADKISPTISDRAFIMAPTNNGKGEPGMGYYILGHGGSGDHGSEDRVRGICRVLPGKPELYSASLEEDWRYGLGELAGLNRHLPGAPERQMNSEDWCIMLRPGLWDKPRRSGKMLLWGWTPGADDLSRSAIRRLRRFHRIIVSDPQSVELLAAVGLRKNVLLGPEPTFLVGRQLRPLQGAFRQDTLGLCFSPAVSRFERSQGLLYRSYCHLIQWVLDNTSWQIALIPYCVKAYCNDETLLMALNRQFCQTGRMVCRGDGDCRVLRGDLSMCRCCVGTAGTLAAWSCGVPGLCIGSSVRARSLSQMLFGSSCHSVASVGALKTEDTLTNCFRAFLKQEDVLRRRLDVRIEEIHCWAADWNWQDAV
jgi:hypothetical protein